MVAKNELETLVLQKVCVIQELEEMIQQTTQSILLSSEHNQTLQRQEKELAHQSQQAVATRMNGGNKESDFIHKWLQNMNAFIRLVAGTSELEVVGEAKALEAHHHSNTLLKGLHLTYRSNEALVYYSEITNEVQHFYVLFPATNQKAMKSGWKGCFAEEKDSLSMWLCEFMHAVDSGALLPIS